MILFALTSLNEALTLKPSTGRIFMAPPGRILIPIETIVQRIYIIRGQKVMLDRDLAEIYGVTPKRLNGQVKRNRGRFPADFMFRLTLQEVKVPPNSRSQFATLKRGQNFKYAPHEFTERGAVMLTNIRL